MEPTREQLWDPNYDFRQFVHEVHDWAERLVPLLGPEVSDLCQGAREAFDRGDLSEVPYLPIRALPPLPRIFVWHQLTSHPWPGLPFAKHVHRHLAAAILELYGVTVPVGPVVVPAAFKKSP